jgi:competence protein ComEC
MGGGIDGIMAEAREAARWPAAATVMQAMPGLSLWLLTLGGLWLCLWRTAWRLWGLAPVGLAFVLGTLHRPPDILISADARLVGVRTASGGMLLSSERAERFIGESWMRRAGVPQASLWPLGTQSADGRLRCDDLGCIYSRDGRRIAIVNKVDGLVDDCGGADIVVALVPVRRRCPSARQVIDRFDMWRYGAHALWLRDDGTLRVETARQVRGDRPWVPKPETRPRTAAAGGRHR